MQTDPDTMVPNGVECEMVIKMLLKKDQPRWK